MEEKSIMDYETLALDDAENALVIIDQTKLPGRTELLHLKTQKEIWVAINTLQVRGAPAIGDAAAIGIYLAAREIATEDYDTFCREFARAKEYLDSSRPTAVNLSWALRRMEGVVQAARGKSVAEIKQLLHDEAVKIKEEDIWICQKLGEYGLTLVKPGDGLLTHCNAGQLATAKYGTATAPMYLGHKKGYNFKIFSDETRPLLQGARLTSYELHASGLDVTLICDNMASSVMKNGWVQAVFVGCDRVAANGDAANKIGTSGVAILAKHYGIPSTGNGRRESFRCMPMPRMRATYMDPGNVKEEDIIASVKKGIFVDQFTNGQVQIGAGDFTFFVKSGYLIEDGKLTQPIKDINIIGNGPKALADITMVADNAKIDNGTWACGKDGQSCPVTCGMPSALVSKLTVGGSN